MKPFIAGIDVGETNLAISFVEAESKNVATVLRINMTVRGTDKLKLAPDNYGRVVYFWVKKYADLFMQTRKVNIELQPQHVGRTKMHIIQAHLESVIRCLFPHIELVLVNPKSVRKWLGTSGGDYKTRKSKSIHAGVFTTSDILRMKRLFVKEQYSKRTKKWTVRPKIDDVVEASELALFGCVPDAPAPSPIEVVFENVTEPAVYVMRNVQMRVPEHAKRTRSESTEPKKKRQKTSA